MINIFEGLEKMNEEMLTYQAASLETITLSNLMGEKGSSLKSSAVRAFNKVSSLWGGKESKVPETITISQKLQTKKDELSNLTSKELIELIRKILINKVNAAGGHLSEKDSDEQISVEVIELATKCYKKEIDSNLTYSQKADAICSRYTERMLAQVQKQMEAQNESEKIKTNKAIEAQLTSMDKKQQEELEKALGAKKLTAEMIRKQLTTTGGIAATMIALNASGFGAYMALTTIMHAVFTTTLGITLPFAAYTSATSVLSFLIGPFGWIMAAGMCGFAANNVKNKVIYELFAQVVWVSVQNYGRKFTTAEEELPSWLPSKEREEAVRRQNELLKLINENEELKNKTAEMEAEKIKKENDIRNYEKKINSIKADIELKKKSVHEKEIKIKELWYDIKIQKEEYEKQQEKIRVLENSFNEVSQDEKNKLEEYKRKYEKTEKNCRKLMEEKESFEDYLDMQDKEIESKNNEILKLQREINIQNEKITELSDEVKKSNDSVNKITEREEKKLAERWSQTFKKFKFSTGVIKSVIKNFEYNELGAIESLLVDIHSAQDPAALQANRGKMKGSDELHAGFSTPSGFPSRIFYKPIKSGGHGKTVEITQICKHNESRYGKRKK